MNKKRQSIIRFLLIFGILFSINIIASRLFFQVDLTEDKRYSITPATTQMLQQLEDPLYIEVYLEGEFPAGFRRLQNEVINILQKFRSVSNQLEYRFVNPNEGSADEVNKLRERLKEIGINPVNLQVKGGTEYSEQLIYPAATVHYKGRTKSVKLLSNQTPGTPQEVVLNNSVSLLEYQFANTIEKIQLNFRKTIAYTTGHGELFPVQTADIDDQLKAFYSVGRLNLDSLVRIDERLELLIVAKPRFPFSEKDKFKIDQYVMNGGKVLWLIDRLNVSNDSLIQKPVYVPFDYPLNLEDILFKYGVRINPNLVADLDCSPIPLQVGELGNAPQYDLRPWFFHPAVTAKSNHPIVKGLDRVNFKYPSSIDTVKTKAAIKKTPLLVSSDYTRVNYMPYRLNFDISRYKPQVDKFNKPNQVLAVLLEGRFPSLYKNRISPEMQAGYNDLGYEVKYEGVPTSMLVASDGDIIQNPYNPRDNSFKPLGFNIYDRYTYANRAFLINAIEYMLNDKGVITARTKEVKLRLLNKVKADEEKSKWQFLNIGLPLILLAIFGLIFNYIRRKRYGGS